MGWSIAPLFTFLLPSREEMDADSYAKGTRVTVTRRIFAWLIDWGILNVVSFIVVIAVRLLTQQTVRDFSGDYWYFALEVLLYFVLFAYLAKGQTIGKKLVRIKIMQEARQRVSLAALLKRYGLFYLIYASISRVNIFFAPFLDSDNTLLLVVSLLMVVIFGLIQFGFYMNLFWAAIKKESRFFYERRSATYTISTIDPKPVTKES